mmetsp:Transcript_19340/g.53155  ORF Transcript_19340/g.53155 Transcript_19340/m.53155 type:complete len:746 (+) Transcript_19340:1043-3280(+)
MVPPICCEPTVSPGVSGAIQLTDPEPGAGSCMVEAASRRTVPSASTRRRAGIETSAMGCMNLSCSPSCTSHRSKMACPGAVTPSSNMPMSGAAIFPMTARSESAMASSGSPLRRCSCRASTVPVLGALTVLVLRPPVPVSLQIGSPSSTRSPTSASHPSNSHASGSGSLAPCWPSWTSKGGNGPMIASALSFMTSLSTIPSVRCSWTPVTTPGLSDFRLLSEPSGLLTMAIMLPVSTTSPSFAAYLTNSRPPSRSSEITRGLAPSPTGSGSSLPMVMRFPSSTNSRSSPFLRLSCRALTIPFAVDLTTFSLPLGDSTTKMPSPSWTPSYCSLRYFLNFVPLGRFVTCGSSPADRSTGSGARLSLPTTAITWFEVRASKLSPFFSLSCTASTMPSAGALTVLMFPSRSCTLKSGSPVLTASPSSATNSTKVSPCLLLTGCSAGGWTGRSGSGGAAPSDTVTAQYTEALFAMLKNRAPCPSSAVSVKCSSDASWNSRETARFFCCWVNKWGFFGPSSHLPTVEAANLISPPMSVCSTSVRLDVLWCASPPIVTLSFDLKSFAQSRSKKLMAYLGMTSRFPVLASMNLRSMRAVRPDIKPICMYSPDLPFLVGSKSPSVADVAFMTILISWPYSLPSPPISLASRTMPSPCPLSGPWFPKLEYSTAPFSSLRYGYSSHTVSSSNSNWVISFWKRAAVLAATPLEKYAIAKPTVPRVARTPATKTRRAFKAVGSGSISRRKPSSQANGS